MIKIVISVDLKILPMKNHLAIITLYRLLSNQILLYRTLNPLT